MWQNQNEEPFAYMAKHQIMINVKFFRQRFCGFQNIFPVFNQLFPFLACEKKRYKQNLELYFLKYHKKEYPWLFSDAA